MISLRELFLDIPELAALSYDEGIFIRAVSGSIQDCCEGCLFVADVSETADMDQTGHYVDGAQFIDGAIQQGALVIVTRPDVDISGYDDSKVTFIQVDNPLQYLGKLAGRFYGYQKPDFVAAVTGTNGKTSSTSLAAQLFDMVGARSLSIGNIGVHEAGRDFIYDLPDQLSVPETVHIHRMLSEYGQQDVGAIFFEATSHALHGFRFEGVKLDAAAFTNITLDHLDFHKDMDEYFSQKMRLFEDILAADGTAIINADMDRIDELRASCNNKGYNIIEFGYNASESDLKLISYEHIEQGIKLRFIWQDEAQQVELPLMGEFNAYNFLCALAFVQAGNLDKDVVLKSLDKLKPIKGRLEFVAKTNEDAKIYIDYAHSPDALEQLLKSGKETAKGRVIVVFHCNGDRDKQKRKIMGSIASSYADISYITDGFVRSEQAGDIREQILEGFDGSSEVVAIEGRERAIVTAIQNLQANDHLYIAGMGHEKWLNDNGEFTTDLSVVQSAL